MSMSLPRYLSVPVALGNAAGTLTRVRSWCNNRNMSTWDPPTRGRGSADPGPRTSTGALPKAKPSVNPGATVKIDSHIPRSRTQYSTDLTDQEPTDGRARRHAAPTPTLRQFLPRRPSALITLGVALVIWIGALWTGLTFGASAAASDGEPAEVIVATWMRDNNMGWIVARLEDVYYTYIDTAQVGGTPTISADLTSEDTAGLDEPAVVAAEPEPEASAAIDHLQPPDPIVSPVDTPEPKEGEWQPVGSRVAGIPAIYVTRVRADDVHTSYYASAMWIDTKLAKSMFVPGYQEPGGPNPFNGALPEALWPQVLANVNGGFRLADSMGGYYYDGEMVKPLVKGKATALFTKDGKLRIGKWGRDFDMTDDVLAARQNLDLIVDKGESMVKNANDNVVWGATTDKESLAWRAAIGEREDGSLVYVGSPYLSAEGLANTLVGAGVQRAMVLDMNNWWTAGFFFRHKADGTPLCRKLDPAIQEGCDRFLKPYKRDSFHFLAADGLPIGNAAASQ